MLKPMKVEELIRELQQYPKDLNVLIMVDCSESYSRIDVRGIPATEPNCLMLSIMQSQSDRVAK